MKAGRADWPTVTVRVAPDIRDRLQAQADRRDVSLTYLAAKAIERALPAWEETELP